MLELYAHPFSSYCWKVLIALWENDLPFTYHHLGPEHPEHGAALNALWPLGKFPVLVDDGRAIPETSVIIEHLGVHHPRPVSLIPSDADDALEVRLLDRIFDNYVMGAMQRVVNDALRPPERRDPAEVSDAKAALDTIYAWLDQWMAEREWAAAGAFSLADCGAAPALFYADWVHEIGDYPHLRAYRNRLLARPSVMRAVDEARPFRAFFPLGAPDRD